jgi:adenylylsulfate kinase
MSSGFVVWLTGLPGSGKTTIAKMLEPKLKKLGVKVELLDGDEVRRQLSPDLGFTKDDRELHAKRVVYLSKLLARNGIGVIVSLISPYNAFRTFARQEIGDFVEVYVSCSLKTCINRDPKGLYKKAISGEIQDLTGVQDPYEEPTNPEITVNTENESVEQSVEKILYTLKDLGYLTNVIINWSTIVQDPVLRRLVTEHSSIAH